MATTIERTTVERTTRWVAGAAVTSSAVFFGWYALAMGSKWGAVMPFFGGLVVAWLAALLGIGRRRWWSAPYAAGLSILTVALMSPAASRPDVVFYLVTQLVLLSALGVRAMHERERGLEARTWRHATLAFMGGLAVPWVLAAGLLPGGGAMGLVGLGAAALACLGLFGAFRERTWGLLTIGLSIPLLLAIPPSSWGCLNAPHDVAGEVSAITLGAGLLVWITPLFARLRAR
jgi:hypothetical protein